MTCSYVSGGSRSFLFVFLYLIHLSVFLVRLGASVSLCTLGPSLSGCTCDPWRRSLILNRNRQINLMVFPCWWKRQQEGKWAALASHPVNRKDLYPRWSTPSLYQRNGRVYVRSHPRVYWLHACDQKFTSVQSPNALKQAVFTVSRWPEGGGSTWGCRAGGRLPTPPGGCCQTQQTLTHTGLYRVPPSARPHSWGWGWAALRHQESGEMTLRWRHRHTKKFNKAFQQEGLWNQINPLY